MALNQLPTFAHIAELQLSIALVERSVRRPSLKTRGPQATLTEMWRGQIAFADVSAANARVFASWAEWQDGRVQAFGVTLRQGFATHANNFAGTITVAALPGDSFVYLASSAGSQSLLSGTLLAIGAPGAAGYQVVELLDDATLNSAASLVPIAPRIRKQTPAGTAVAGGDVQAALRFTGDMPGVTQALFRGVTSFDVIEAVL